MGDSTKGSGTRGEIALYRQKRGGSALEVRLERETVWLTQAQMAELFSHERSVITKHLRNIFREGELPEKGNVQNLHIPSFDQLIPKFQEERDVGL